MKWTTWLNLPSEQPSPKQYVATCPVCQSKSLVVTELCYKLPNFGDVYLLSASCSTCGFKHTDILELSPHQEPSRYTVKVESPRDLNVLVVRSSSASVVMPELGVTITPGPYAQGVITTIEGFLHKAKEIVEFLLSSEVDEERKRRCLDILKRLDKAIDGEEHFTFIIEDPSGLSVVVPKEGVPTKIIKEPLASGD